MKEQVFAYVCRWCGQEREVKGHLKLTKKQQRHYLENPCLPCQLSAVIKSQSSAGTISKEEAKALIDADDCDADFGIHQFERAGK